MDAKQFLSEFGHIVSAPRGVQWLRELIFQLAIRGRLVTTSKLAKSALELIAAIADHTGVLIEQKEIRRHLPLLPIDVAELDFEVPSTWSFARLGNVCEIVRGVTFPASQKRSIMTDDLVACLRTTNVQTEIDWNDLLYIDAQLVRREDQWLRSGDIIISMANSYALVGKVALVEEVKQRATFGGFLAAIRPYLITSEYLYIVMRSPYMQSRMRDTANQTTNIANISLGGIRPILVPVPPIEDQKRIVAKVNELMALCNKLEAQQQERGALCRLTRTATLHALTGAKDSLKLELAWARVNANMGILDSKQSFIDLQYSLTKLAVRGLLCNWTQDFPPVDEIKEECTALKQEYIRKEWLRTRNSVSPKLYESNAYPPHWAVVPLDEVAIIIGGVTKGHKLRGEDMRSCVYLRVANVQRGFFELTEMKHIEVPVHQIEKYSVESGDLLVAEGGDWDKVGRTAIWAGEIPNCLHQNHIFKVRVPSSLLVKEWIELVLNSEVGRDYFAEASKQTTNLASINMTQLRSFPLPIPPISEQMAILKKFKHLLSICQKLERKWLELNNVASLLATAAIASITGIQIEDKEKMKAPKTELVSTLRIGVSPANRERAPLAAILIRNNGEMLAKTLWQTSGLEIDEFYQNLKTEMARGWIVQPEVAHMREVEAS